MSSTRFLLPVAVALLCLLLVPSALADICIGQPSSIAIGGNCGNVGFCRKGSYCNYEGVCTALLKVGASCNNAGDACVSGATCLGATGFQVCVQNVGLGAPCSTSPTTSTNPVCDTSYMCNPVTNLCASGYPGDTCQTSADCITSCTSGVCSFFPVGAACVSSAQCALGSYCSLSASPVCTPLPTVGATCTGSCAFSNMSCIATSSTSTQTICVAQGSLSTGSYCNGVNAVCKSSVCYNSYCANAPPQYCNYNSQCGSTMVCQCDGNEFVSGYGYCTSASCVSQTNNFVQCVSNHCLRSNVGVGTCANSSCLSQYNSLYSCSSASSLFSSFSFIAFVAFLAAFFTKEF